MFNIVGPDHAVTSSALSPATLMKHLIKKIKREKSTKPPLQPIPPGKPAGILAGSPGFQAELDAGPEGGCSRYRDCF